MITSITLIILATGILALSFALNRVNRALRHIHDQFQEQVKINGGLIEANQANTKNLREQENINQSMITGLTSQKAINDQIFNALREMSHRVRQQGDQR